MTENEAMELMESLVIDTKCELVKTLDFKGTVIKALGDLQQYRAIGTVEGYERAIQSSIENYNLYREYKAKVQEFEEIGTIEEFKALKEDKNFLEFLYNHIPPNEMEQYLSMYHIKEKIAVNGYADQSGLMSAT